MNERLQFSWGHIMAFTALITVSYISFVGCTYLTNGNLTTSIICMGVTEFVFILFFIGAQQIKATGIRMGRKIIWERFLIYGSPIVYMIGMIPMSHFWTVKSQNTTLVQTFKNSLNCSKQLFTDYEEYSHQRIESYRKNLTQIVSNRQTDQRSYRMAGFDNSKDAVQLENMVETLRLQLFSQNYDSLKSAAYKWIDDASQGASTWNVIVLGNTREIKDAIGNWENKLKYFASKEMSNESMSGPVNRYYSSGANRAITALDSLATQSATQRFPSLTAITFGIITYFMLILPYVIQERHTKNVYRLNGTESNPKQIKRRPPAFLYKSTKEESYGNTAAETILPYFEEDEDFPSF